MRQTEFFNVFASCCPFTTLTPHPSPLMITEKQSLEQKWKKCLEILFFYTYMYAINEHHDIWFLKCKVWLTQIFVILCNFLPFQSHNSSENQNSKTEKSTWRYYHFTHLPHKWQPYDVWFLRYDGKNFLLFWIIFLPFYPPNNLKNKNLKENEKNASRYYLFTIAQQK